MNANFIIKGKKIRNLLIFTLVFCLVPFVGNGQNAIQKDGSENLILNGGFENWTNSKPDQWTYSSVSGASIAQESTIKTEGNYSVKLMHTGTKDAAKLSVKYIPVTAGQVMNLKMDYYLAKVGVSSGTNPNGIRYWGTWKKADSTTVSKPVTGWDNLQMGGNDYISTPLNQWGAIDLEVTVPEGAAFLDLDVRWYKGVTAYVDNVKLVTAGGEQIVDCANITDFKAVAGQGDGTTVYRIAKAVLTGKDNFNMLYVQDENAGLCIFDPDQFIGQDYVEGDVFPNLIGTYANGMFTTVQAAGAVTEHTGKVNPIVVTLEQLNANVSTYVSRLVVVKNVNYNFIPAIGLGGGSTISDGTNTLGISEQLMSEEIPSSNQNDIDVTGVFIDGGLMHGLKLAPRSLEDFASNGPDVKIDLQNIDFANVIVGVTKEKVFTVTPKNLTSNLTITSDNPAFTVSPSSIGQSIVDVTDVYVTFAPTAVQTYNGNITVSGGGLTSDIVVSVTGVGLAEGTIIDVENISKLKELAGNGDENTKYRLAKATVSAVEGFNMLYVQDENAGLCIFDPDQFIGQEHIEGDVIPNIVGTYFYGQFTPTEAPGETTENTGKITPIEVTITQLNANKPMYESRLVVVKNVNYHYVPAVGLGGGSTISDGSNEFKVSGMLMELPSKDKTNINLAAVFFNGGKMQGYQLAPRTLTDFTENAVVSNNLIVNGSFENWTGDVLDDWKYTASEDGVSSFTKESTIKTDGQYAVKVQNTGKTATLAAKVINVTGGQQYKLSLDYYVTSASTGNGVRYWGVWFDADGKRITTGDEAKNLQPEAYLKTPMGQWNTAKVVVTAPTNAVTLQLDIRWYKDVTAYLDNYVFEKSAGDMVANPVIAFEGAGMGLNTYLEFVKVKMSCATAGATILYSIDGSEPSLTYTDLITITSETDGGPTYTVKAKATKSGLIDSDVISATVKVSPKVTKQLPYGPEMFATAGSLSDWAEHNVIGEQMWVQSSYDGKSYVKMTGYVSGNIANEDWLISPEFNVTKGGVLTFESAAKFIAAGSELKLLYSTNYNGYSAPADATWTDITSQAQWSTDNYIWVNSGDVIIPSGKVYIAFKYTSTTAAAATWEITNISLVDKGDVLPAPVAKAATELTATSFIANWNAVMGAESYLLFVKDLTTDAMVLDEFETTNTSWQIDVEVSSSRLYEYSVVAKSGEVKSNHSNLIQVQLPVGVENLESSANIFAYNGIVNIDLNSEIRASVIVTDLGGKVLSVSQTDDFGKGRIELNNESKGVYIVRIVTSEGEFAKKVIIK